VVEAIMKNQDEKAIRANANQAFVRDLLAQRQPVLAEVLDTLVRTFVPASVIPAREYEPGYDAERELQDWMNSMRTRRNRP